MLAAVPGDSDRKGGDMTEKRADPRPADELLIALHRRWQQATAVADMPRIGGDPEALCDEIIALEHAMIAEPAASAAGLLAKLAIIESQVRENAATGEPDIVGKMILSAVADAKRLLV